MTKTKKVLMIAHQFPPMGGSGVQRTSKFVKYLRDFGWEPIVFTREVAGMPIKDETLLNDIPDGIKVIRSSACDFTQWPGIFVYAGKIISRKFLIPDGERLWQQFGRKMAEKAVIENNIDAIYTTSSPYSDHLMGLHLKSKFPNIPWVADFRDEWTNNPYMLDNPHNKIRLNIEKKMEKSVLTNADYLITNTPVMLKNFLDNNSDITGLSEKFTVIPNGFDKEDFESLSDIRPQNERFTLTYTGALYGRRKPDAFLEAVGNLVKENKVDKSKFNIQFIGNLKTDILNALVTKFDLDGSVTLLPYMAHNNILIELFKSDALLLIEGGGRGAEAFYTGKVFEYMVTKRPVLAMIPENGAAADLIRKTKIGVVSGYNDIKTTSQNFLLMYTHWVNNKISVEPDWDLINTFERRNLTSKLSDVLNTIVEMKGR